MIAEIKHDPNINREIKIKNYVAKINKCYETIAGKYYTVSVELERSAEKPRLL